MIDRKQWLGRAIALGILVGATIVVALALLRLDAPIPQVSIDELRWRGVPRGPFEALVERLAAPALRGRVHHWVD